MGVVWKWFGQWLRGALGSGLMVVWEVGSSLTVWAVVKRWSGRWLGGGLEVV